MATTVGWELEVESQVVVVTSVQPASGDQPETITVQDSGGNTSTMEVVREDNADNGVELEGSEVPEDTSGSATTQSSTDESPPASESSCAVSRSPAAGAVPLATVGLALALRRWAVARPHGLN